MKKYISLFPPEVRGSNGLLSAPVKEDDGERSQVRTLIRSRMERGELSLEPENELERPDWERKSRSRHGTNPSDHSSSKKSSIPAQDASEDEFFGNDDEEENLQPSSSDSD